MEAYIYDAVRTPRGRGKPDGSLHEITPIQLATQTLEAIRDRNSIDTADVDDVILGCVTPVGEQGADIARTAVLNADYAQTTPGVQVNRFCASGLEAVNIAAAKVMSGEALFAIGGGVESMSRVPMASDGGAIAMDPAVAYKTYFAPQGIGADVIATKFGISRDDADAYAVESQKRAKMAWDEGRFAKSIVPVRDVIGQIVLDHDEHMRPDATMQSLGALKPSFTALGEEMPGFDTVALLRYPELERVNHIHHAGNSSGIVDGAAAVLVGGKDIGDKYGLKPRARIRAMASIGSEPLIMLTGPEFVAGKLLSRAGMTAADIDLWELNEAFASVVLRYMQAMKLDHDQINVNGGAIAMGHPLGATGAMVLGTALDELERSGKGTALINLCVGAGMGTGIIIERI
ncbi:MULTISPECIES: acetyl-CoA C-acetyltransferase [unclassified Sphingobium]|uniref:acetyl-CoA C-acetyltransferase n=1 Tax=unclassified Sphingobium TaxID=2611147 RepID=UPI000D1605DE|nr:MULTISPECIES: acetyl-CoA C-acetyltransferase [unclassified Sphingobium]MBG6119617.1 acetyl-CoA C-acetyltransferase [Sphingobium sp. JAI105]PSO13297.1 acetyl-CoA acetyltransferase [Sphingobium sp. AEW4]TWD11531.1 acetyl-CoA C-acetyltransferase [Sphingobium sp. AEW010]TWD28578.1 acetyl-CoA C-acetyltransferase [Sphingobium sp. AEW013]TWD30073.1 acetyl-CoA C-acetyltransferase [Sphingobium sp. AEW001]